MSEAFDILHSAISEAIEDAKSDTPILKRTMITDTNNNSDKIISSAELDKMTQYAI